MDSSLKRDEYTETTDGADKRERQTEGQDLVILSVLQLWPVEAATEFHSKGSGHPNMRKTGLWRLGLGLFRSSPNRKLALEEVFTGQKPYPLNRDP